jgi:PAS domain S-box-containing protein
MGTTKSVSKILRKNKKIKKVHKTIKSRVRNVVKYQDLINNLSVGVYRNTLGPKGHFLEANPAIVSMFEADSKEEFMKHNVSDLYEDPTKRSLFVEKIKKYGFVKNEELNLVTLKGRKIIGSVTAVIKINKDGTGYTDGVIDNITERKETEEMLKNAYNNLEIIIKKRTKNLENAKLASQNILEDLNIEKLKYENLSKDLEKFKLALDNTSEQVVITDVKGVAIYANPAVEKITGYTPAEVIGKKSGALWKKPMPEEFYQKLWDTIEKEKKVFIGEIENRRKNGEVYTAAINISPIFNKNKEIIYFVSIERDVTREKEIDKAKSEFISLSSHQLRTPLTTISWYTEMILKGDVGKVAPDQKKYLEEIYKGNKRMIELVNTLLSVSHFELGTFNIEPEPVHLKDIAESVLRELKPQILSQKINIEKNYDSSLPMIFTDPKLIRIIFQNLLGNAVKYVEINGKIRLDISIQKSNALIKIWNNGMGIPKVAQPKIFTKLFRDDFARQKDPDGNGLGLYIVKSIVENFGGKVWFESPTETTLISKGENMGTAFYVTLPLSGVKKKESVK